MPVCSVRLVLKDRLMAESLAVGPDLRVADLTVVPCAVKEPRASRSDHTELPFENPPEQGTG
jgi:hypothetical protein